MSKWLKEWRVIHVSPDRGTLFLKVYTQSALIPQILEHSESTKII